LVLPRPLAVLDGPCCCEPEGLLTEELPEPECWAELDEPPALLEDCVPLLDCPAEELPWSELLPLPMPPPVWLVEGLLGCDDSLPPPWPLSLELDAPDVLGGPLGLSLTVGLPVSLALELVLAVSLMLGLLVSLDGADVAAVGVLLDGSVEAEADESEVDGAPVLAVEDADTGPVGPIGPGPGPPGPPGWPGLPGQNHVAGAG
jgi:hypothetical protein